MSRRLAPFNYTLDFETIDFRKRPELYRIGKSEQGVLLVEPYPRASNYRAHQGRGVGYLVIASPRNQTLVTYSGTNPHGSVRCSTSNANANEVSCREMQITKGRENPRGSIPLFPWFWQEMPCLMVLPERAFQVIRIGQRPPGRDS